MTARILRFAALAGALIACFAGALAPAAPQTEEPMSPQEILESRVGTWDCVMKVWPGPGEPLVSKGTEVVRALGEHVLADFESHSESMPFEGHGITSWDAAEGGFVTVWVDSISPVPAILEGELDASTGAVTFVGEASMMGQTMKVRQVATAQDADHRTLEMFVTPPGGEETRSMRVDYTRRK